MIQCQSLSKSFGHTEAVSDLDLELVKGQVVGLLGRNGSGKSTLMKLIAGLTNPTKGAITIAGHPPQQSRNILAYVGDYLGFYPWMTKRDISQAMSALFQDFNRRKFNHITAELDIPNHEIGKMSKGQQQKLKLCATMARDSSLYLLDEPLSGIDILTRNEILTQLIGNREPNSLVIVTTHEIKDVEACLDHSIFMKDGRKVLDQSAKQILDSGQTITEKFIHTLQKNVEGGSKV